MRGEHTMSRYPISHGTGSSPHARGPRQTGIRQCATQGIIPACAGNTTTATAALTSLGDHPRMRGEHAALNVEALAAAGSSPHARGTLPTDCCMRTRTGIIPACAGNTGSDPPTFARSGDHPRMRGEHASSLAISKSWKGSSPHARGTQGVHERRP